MRDRLHPPLSHISELDHHFYLQHPQSKKPPFSPSKPYPNPNHSKISSRTTKPSDSPPHTIITAHFPHPHPSRCLCTTYVPSPSFPPLLPYQTSNPSTAQVTLKENASPEELNKAKSKAKDSGGEIKHEFTLIKGFTVEFPDDKVGVLQTNEHIHVEQDGEVKTQ